MTDFLIYLALFYSTRQLMPFNFAHPEDMSESILFDDLVTQKVELSTNVAALIHDIWNDHRRL